MGTAVNLNILSVIIVDLFSADLLYKKDFIQKRSVIRLLSRSGNSFILMEQYPYMKTDQTIRLVSLHNLFRVHD